MTEYADEQIRYVINQVEAEERYNSQNIYEGITIQEKQYEFQEMGFFDDKLKMQIPTNFVDMPLELAAIKYPASDRPQIIKTDENGSINITMNLLPHKIGDENIPKLKEGIEGVIKTLHPTYLFFEDGVETVSEKTIGFFEFKSSTRDTSLFNVMFILEFEHKILLENFSCSYGEYLPWRPIARQIMQSIRVCSNQQAADIQTKGGPCE